MPSPEHNLDIKPNLKKITGISVEDVYQIDADIEQNQQELLQRLTGKISGAQQEAFSEAYIDTMTATLNRRGLIFLEEKIRNQEESISIIGFDGDHFGTFNEIDPSGKLGDHMIKIIAKNLHQMTNTLREQDFDIEFVRMGGEEFTIFGNISKEKIAEEMEKTRQKIQDEIQNYFTEIEKMFIAHEIARSKYALEYYTKGVEVLFRAANELGGATSAINEFNFKDFDPEKHDAHKVMETVIQAVDEFAVAVKASIIKNKGRNTTAIDPRSQYRPGKPGSEAWKEAIYLNKNRLTESQNQKLAKLTMELKKEVEEELQSRMQTNKLIEEIKETHGTLSPLLVDIAQDQEFQDFLRLPTFKKEDILKMTERTGLTETEITELKTRYIEDDAQYRTYTGATTTNKLSKLLNEEGSGFNNQNTFKVDIGSFKSFNETLGHTFGDTIITYMYQRVVRETIKESEIQSDEIVVAQKGASFMICLHSKVQHKQEIFIEALMHKYQERMHELYQFIDEDIDYIEEEPYEELRKTWIQQNKPETVPVMDNIIISHPL